MTHQIMDGFLNSLQNVCVLFEEDELLDGVLQLLQQDVVRRQREDRLETRQDPAELQPDVGNGVLGQQQNVVVEMQLEILLREKGDGHFGKQEVEHPGPATFAAAEVFPDPSDDLTPVLLLDGEPEDDEDRSSSGHPTRQRARVEHPDEEQRDELGHDGQRADAVCQTRELLQAVSLKPPVSRQDDGLFAVQQRPAQPLAVLSALSGKEKNSMSGQGVDDVNLVADHR